MTCSYLAWLTCYILTVTEAFPEGNAARTDLKTSAISEAPWVIFPLPGQWGTPRVSLPLVLGMFCGILASIVESVGDYHACARFSGAPPPPPHAVNRGICMEGFCCLLAGIWGSGLGVTSFSENIGAIAITKVGSRRVMQWTALLLFICAVFGKVGAVLATLPLPIVGGALIAVFRNAEADDVLMVLLTTGMFVAGIVGFFLDNTIPENMDFTSDVNLDCNLTTTPEANEADPLRQSLDNDIGGAENQMNPGPATELIEDA
ncbi:solute carrier family 23 member 1-like [Ptychodera flava]|uniref:solute carrier family 23 member 1-like n=1 Tax=Ptychodera flava TaxID=63121 RepID=UPI00396A91AF